MTTFLFIVGLVVATAALALWSLTVAGVFVGLMLIVVAIGLELAKVRPAPRVDA